MMRAIYYLLALCGLIALAFSLASAQTVTPGAVASGAPSNVREVIERMEDRNAALNSFTARVHVRLHTSIPFYSPKLDGTSYYKRPNSFALVFDRVPSYMKGFQKLFNDVGDPAGWQKDQNIALQGISNLDGKPMLVLVLTKKIYSDQIKDAIVYVDPVTYEVPQMEWHYTNGGEIVMKQYYQTEDGFSVVARQTVESNYRLRGKGEAIYEPYRTNVPVQDAVFNP